MPSVELVPQSDDRFAWNVLHSGAPDSAELPYHNSQLTAEQAARVDQNYAIEFYLGTHGLGDTQFHNRYAAPTQKEYDAAAAVVDSLKPGDVLFVEGYGFTHPISVGREIAEIVNAPPIPRSSLGSLLSSVRVIALEEQRKALEAGRANGKISAWAYATGLAQLKGNEVIMADADAYDMERFSGHPIVGSGSENFHQYRERAAINIVKDWALEHLPDVDDNIAEPAEKRRLVLLFGSGHEADLKRQCQERGLNVSFTTLEASTLQERAWEHFNPIGLLAVIGLSSMPLPEVGARVPRSDTKKMTPRPSGATPDTLGSGFSRRALQLRRTRFNARPNSIDKGLDKETNENE